MPVLVLRDGTRLRIKEGVDPEAAYRQYMSHKARERQANPEFQAKVAAQEAADREEYNPTKGMSNLDKFGAGLAQGVHRVGRGLADITGLMDPEDVAAKNKLDQALLDTKAGSAGSFVGNTAALIAATAPVGAGLSTAGLAGTTGKTLLNLAGQGAAAGAINANPGDRGAGAALGGIIGAGTGALFKGGEKLLSRGVAQYSDDALALQKSLPDSHIPLAEGLKDSGWSNRVLKSLYSLAREDPIGGTQLLSQSGQLADDVVGKVGGLSTPRLAGGRPRFTSGQTPLARQQNWANIQKIQQQIDDLQAPLKKVMFDLRNVGGKTPTHYHQTVHRALSEVGRRDPALRMEIQKILDEAMPPTPQGLTTGERVLRAISDLKAFRNARGGSSATGSAQEIDKVVKSLRDWGARRFGPQGNRADLAPIWRRTALLYDKELWKWNNFVRAAAQKGDGSISSGSLVEGMKGGNATWATGKIPLQQLATGAKRVTEEELQRMQGAFGTNIRLGAIPTGVFTLGGGAVGGPVGAAAGASVLPALGMKTVQRALTGTTATQKAIAEFLRTRPDLVQRLSEGTTAALVPQGE